MTTIDGKTNKRVMFEMSADARFLIQRLSKLRMGESISYAELTKEVGKKVTGSFGALQTAKKRLLEDENMRFEPVRGVGLRRLTDGEIVSAAKENISRLRKGAKSSSRKLFAADFSSLNNREQLNYTTHLSVFGAVASMTTQKGIDKVERSLGGRSGELPIAETLAAFTK